MEYVAVFVWLTICLLLGGLMHAMLRTAFEYKWVKLLTAPGVVVRKFAMTVTALASGATVTQVNMYRLSERDIGFEAKGMASVSRALLPVAPLFASALVLQVVNAALGRPLRMEFSPPMIGSLDAGGALGFARGLLMLMGRLARQVMGADWGRLSTYVFLMFVFSFSLGAGMPLRKFRQSLAGIGLVVIGLAVLCALAGLSPGGTPSVPSSQPGPAARWVLVVRSLLVSTAGMALVMMLCGLFASTAVGLTVRIFEMVGGAAKSVSGATSSGRGRKKRAA